MENICACKKISKDQIVQAVNNGAKTFEEVKEVTNAGNGCCKGSRCKSKIIEIIEEN